MTTIYTTALESAKSDLIIDGDGATSPFNQAVNSYREAVALVAINAPRFMVQARISHAKMMLKWSRDMRLTDKGL